MENIDDKKQMITALVKAQSEIGPIVKDRENPFAKSKYVTLDAILETIIPVLTTNGIFLTQTPITTLTETGMKVGVETTLMHTSGETLTFAPFFMELEKGQKMNMAQSAGSIITYAKRYAISAIFGISADEDKDGVQTADNSHTKQNNSYTGNPNQNKPQAPKAEVKDYPKAQKATPAQREYIKRMATELCTLLDTKTNEAFKAITEQAYEAANIKAPATASYNQMAKAVEELGKALNAERKKQAEAEAAGDEQGAIFETMTTNPAEDIFGGK